MHPAEPSFLLRSSGRKTEIGLYASECPHECPHGCVDYTVSLELKLCSDREGKKERKKKSETCMGASVLIQTRKRSKESYLL